jgi:hypothetical protein
MPNLNLSKHAQIVGDIETRRYEKDRCDERDFLKCNIFADDMLQKYWGVEIPRRKEFSYTGAAGSSGNFFGFGNNPASAVVLDSYFEAASRMKESGITKVDPMAGSLLASIERPVLAVGGGHATLASPHQQWPMVYRADRALHGKDQRTSVGLKKDSPLSFYMISPEKYQQFREITREFSGDAIYKAWTDEGKALRKFLGEVNNYGP